MFFCYTENYLSQVLVSENFRDVIIITTKIGS